MIKNISWLDFKLGLRMLIKYPWLTVVGGLGMAVAVAIGATFFGLIYSAMDPTLPLDEGDRVVSMQILEESNANRPERRISRDYAVWRKELKTIQDIGVFRRLSRNVVTPHGEPEPKPVAEITASGFRLARVRPLMGRYLRDTDEQTEAPPVAVIGYDIWKTRFLGDPDILKRNIQIGSNHYQVVGVMPEDFAFPIQHSLWVPLKLDPSASQWRKGPVIFAFGRLAPGVSLDDAQAEMTRLGERIAAESPTTHAQLRPHVLPYTFPFFDIDTLSTVWAFHVLQLTITLLLVLVCANVATLIYARTAARQGELAVRSALGASRWRIIGQLFAEALVLAAVASVVGLTIAKWALRQCQLFLEAQLPTETPFWINMDVSLGVMLYTVGVTLLAAMIVGALPALKATGLRVQSQLRQLGGGSGMQLGKTWTILIVAQVAFAVAIMPGTLFNAWLFGSHGLASPDFPATEYLTATLTIETTLPTTEQSADYRRDVGKRFNELQSQLLQRLRAEPGVAAATFAYTPPDEEPTAMIEIEGLPLPQDSVNYSLGGGTRRGYGVRPNRVDREFFKAFEVPLISGRYLNERDRDSASTAVLVNQEFVRRYLSNRNAIGGRFRYVGRGGDTDSVNVPLGRWFQIVGVVGNLPRKSMNPDGSNARIYHPPLPIEMYNTLFLRVRGAEATNFSARLKQLTTTLDPTLQLRAVRTVDEVLRRGQRMMRLGAIGLLTLTLSVLLLSAAGIYSLMSLAVNQRRREIGIRSALGAQPREILRSVFSRAVRQVVIGVALGVIAAFILDKLLWGEMMRGNAAVLLPLVAVVMMTVGLVAAFGPAKRGLGIQPTEALRDL